MKQKIEQKNTNQMITSFNLYLGCKVEVCLDNGETVVGWLTESVDEKIKIDNQTIAKERVADIFYLGKVTDFHSTKGTGEIDSNIIFSRDAFADVSWLEACYYGEFILFIKCHINYVKVEDEYKLIASDIIVLEKECVLNETQ